MEFDSLSLLAQIGATLAGFAAIVGVVRSDPADLDAAYDIALYGGLAASFSVAAILFVKPPNESVILRLLSTALSVVAVASVVRNIALARRIRAEQQASDVREPLGAVLPGALGGVAMLVVAGASLAAASGFFPSASAILFESALFSCIVVSLSLLVYVLSKHFVLR